MKFKSVEDVLKSIHDSNESILDATSKFLENINSKNTVLNAIVTSCEETEIQYCLDNFDKLRKTGQKLPPLAGLPIAIKDLQETKGILTTFGSKIFRKNIGRTDSPMVRNLKKAGCIVVGKTNVPEFGIGGQTFNSLFGATLNPIDTKLTSGGSSGGAAAAVASGMLPFADGSDMMGSIRTPSSFCSLYGFRPTPHLIPTPRNKENLPPLSSLGGLARSTKCLSFLLDAQVGNFNSFRAPNRLFSEIVNIPIRSEIRCAWLGSFNGNYTYESGIDELCTSYLKTLDSPQIKIETVNPSFPAEQIWDSWTVLRCKTIQSELQHHYLNLEEKKLLKPEILWEIEQGLKITKNSLETAIFLREKWIVFLKSLFKVYDFLLLPSAQVFPFSAKQRYPSAINGVKMDTYHRWMEVVIPASLAGLPTMSIPCGFDSRGLPVGIQLIGKFKSDAEVLRVSNWFERFRCCLTNQ
ncbi:MAG: amidase [Pseudomonadota bacterium]|nr:amidase [Pseudomonadota bacterium]